MRPSAWLVASVVAATSTTLLGRQASQAAGSATVRPAGPADASGLTVTPIALPRIPGALAIWGATGQDTRGHIWFGVATADIPVPSAHLLEYDPATAVMVDRGNVVDELQRLGILRRGEHQAKIHSKIVQGADQCLYFASMDEEGEEDDGSRLPTWGGHLWRLRLATGRWEHLGGTPEALIAVAGGGRYVYALGYFGHVLYQYDTQGGQLRRVEVGSVDGHVTRNFFSDYREHVYVPRLRVDAASGRKVTVSLAEFGPDLREVGDTPIDADRYLDPKGATESHGIVGFQPMADRSIFFTTHRGYLFRVVPPAPGALPRAATVTPVGWVHPAGPTYTPGLFTPDGARTLFALAAPPTGAPAGMQWLTCAVDGGPCRATSFSVPGIDRGEGLLYGSVTRDARGGYYVVGVTNVNNERAAPIVLRVEPAR